MNNNLSFQYGRPRGFGGIGQKPSYGGTPKPGDKPGGVGTMTQPGNTGIVPPLGGGMSAPAPQMPGTSYSPAGGGMSAPAPQMGGMTYSPMQGGMGGGISAPAPSSGGMQYNPGAVNGMDQQMMSLFGGGQSGGMQGYGGGMAGGGMTTRQNPGMDQRPIVRQQPVLTR